MTRRNQPQDPRLTAANAKVDDLVVLVQRQWARTKRCWNRLMTLEKKLDRAVTRVDRLEKEGGDHADQIL